MKRSTSSITAALAAAASDPFPFFSSRKSSTEEEAAGDLSQPLTATQNGHEQEGPVQASSAFSTRDSGVIQVSKGRPDRTVDSEMEALRRIPQFKPLLESSLSPAGFSWGGMFGSQPSTPKADEMPYMIDPAPGIALWEKSRAHIERCSSDIARDQKLLEMSMSNMEEYCTKLANTVVNRCYEAKVQGEKMSALTAIKKQADRTASALDDIIISLEKLDPLLPPAEQLGHPANEKRYPALTKLLHSRRAAEEKEREAASS